MSEEREPLEDAEGAVPQDPCERAKAALPESQSPAVQSHTHCYSVYNAAPSGGGPLMFRDRPPPTGRAMKNDFIQGDEWDT